MEYKEILDSARTCIGPYCKACPVCNGKPRQPGPRPRRKRRQRLYPQLRRLAEDLRQHGHHLPE